MCVNCYEKTPGPHPRFPASGEIEVSKSNNGKMADKYLFCKVSSYVCIIEKRKKKKRKKNAVGTTRAAAVSKFGGLDFIVFGP